LTEQLDSILEYQYKTIKFVSIILSLSAFLAAAMFPIMKLIGFFGDVKWLHLITLIVIVCIEVVLIIFLYKKSINGKEVNLATLNKFKYFILSICYINYIFMSFIIPSKELWISGFYFIILTALFLDLKILSLSISLCIICQGLIFYFNPLTLPQKEILIQEIIIRIVVISLNSFGIFIIAFFASKILKDVGKREIELKKNNNRILNLFNKVSNFAENLLSSGQNLSAIAEEKSSAMQELSYSSQTVVNSTNEVLHKSHENTENLNKLLKTNEIITDKIGNTEEISTDLSQISNENEKSYRILKEVLIRHMKLLEI